MSNAIEIDIIWSNLLICDIFLFMGRIEKLLAKMKKLEYPFTISILSDGQGSGYLIEFPDLPGCVSDGDTLEEAIENGKDAVKCWIETAKIYGDPIPSPGDSDRACDKSILSDININKSLGEK